MAAPTALADRRSGIPAVLAHYRTLLDARRAMRTLRALGIDRRDIALVGEDAFRAVRSGWRRRADGRARVRVVLAMVAGAVGGMVLGAGFGAACMLAAIALFPGIADAPWVVGLVMAWFVAGAAALGAVGGAARGTRTAEALEPAAGAEPDRDVWLAVYGDARVLAPAVEATGPIDVFEGTRALAARGG
jgi:hypothetical protein